MGFERAGTQPQHQVAFVLRRRHGDGGAGADANFSAARQIAGLRVSEPAVMVEPEPNAAVPRPPTVPNRRSRAQQRERRPATASDDVGGCRRTLLGGIHILGRLQAHHQPIAGAVPRVAVGREQVEHDARHGRILLILIDANGEDVFLLDRNFLRDRAQSGSWAGRSPAAAANRASELRGSRDRWRESQPRARRARARCAAPHGRRRTKVLAHANSRRQHGRKNRAHKLEHNAAEEFPRWKLERNISLAKDGRKAGGGGQASGRWAGVGYKAAKESTAFLIEVGNERDDAQRLTSRFRQELVLFNHRGHGEFTIVPGIFYTHHAAFALHADAFGQGYLRRKRQSESDGRSLGHGGVQIEADAAGADVANLRDFACAVWPLVPFFSWSTVTGT